MQNREDSMVITAKTLKNQVTYKQYITFWEKKYNLCSDFNFSRK